MHLPVYKIFELINLLLNDTNLLSYTCKKKELHKKAKKNGHFVFKIITNRHDKNIVQIKLYDCLNGYVVNVIYYIVLENYQIYF